MIAKVINYFKGVKTEATKVTWPSKNQAFKYVAFVIIVSILAAIYMNVIDQLLQKLLLDKII